MKLGITAFGDAEEGHDNGRQGRNRLHTEFVGYRQKGELDFNHGLPGSLLARAWYCRNATHLLNFIPWTNKFKDCRASTSKKPFKTLRFDLYAV